MKERAMHLGSIAGAVRMIGRRKYVLYDDGWSLQRCIYCYASAFLRCRGVVGMGMVRSWTW
jgi:hypothetical protein